MYVDEGIRLVCSGKWYAEKASGKWYAEKAIVGQVSAGGYVM